MFISQRPQNHKELQLVNSERKLLYFQRIREDREMFSIVAVLKKLETLNA
jgi:hypothetical protein